MTQEVETKTVTVIQHAILDPLTFVRDLQWKWLFMFYFLEHFAMPGTEHMPRKSVISDITSSVNC